MDAALGSRSGQDEVGVGDEDYSSPGSREETEVLLMVVLRGLYEGVADGLDKATSGAEVAAAIKSDKQIEQLLAGNCNGAGRANAIVSMLIQRLEEMERECSWESLCAIFFQARPTSSTTTRKLEFEEEERDARWSQSDRTPPRPFEFGSPKRDLGLRSSLTERQQELMATVQGHFEGGQESVVRVIAEAVGYPPEELLTSRILRALITDTYRPLQTELEGYLEEENSSRKSNNNKESLPSLGMIKLPKPGENGMDDFLSNATSSPTTKRAKSPKSHSNEDYSALLEKIELSLEPLVSAGLCEPTKLHGLSVDQVLDVMKGRMTEVARLQSGFQIADNRILMLETKVASLAQLLESASDALSDSQRSASEMKETLTQREGVIEELHSKIRGLQSKISEHELSSTFKNLESKDERPVQAEESSIVATLEMNERRMKSEITDLIKKNRTLRIENIIAARYLRQMNIKGVEFHDLPASLDEEIRQVLNMVDHNDSTQTSLPSSPANATNSGSISLNLAGELGESPPTNGSSNGSSPRRASSFQSGRKRSSLISDDVDFKAVRTMMSLDSPVGYSGARPGSSSSHEGQTSEEFLTDEGILSPSKLPSFMQKSTKVDPSQVDQLVVKLVTSFRAAGIQLPLRKIAPFRFSLHNHVLQMTISNGVLLARTGGGYIDVVDFLESSWTRFQPP